MTMNHDVPNKGHDTPMATVFDEEKMLLRISEAVHEGINKSLNNGLGAKVRELARLESANIIEAHEGNCAKLTAEHLAAERWKLIAIVAICGSGGGGVAAALMKFFGKV